MDAIAPLGHVGHWAVWVLYSVPVLVVLAAAARSYFVQRREQAGAGERDEGIRRARERLGG